MDEKSLKPQLRFKGFADAWEQRKFQDIFSFERPDNYIVKSDKYSNEYTMPVLTANKAFVLGYTKENSPCTKTSLIFDDFTLECKYVDFPYMVKSSAIKILTVKDSKKDNLRFSFERLNTTKIEILGHARHYISVVQPTETRTPEIAEQNKISAFFSNLDNLITLHQRKLDKLSNVKKALLEKMFPKNDSDVPEIRFKGFTDAWEQRKLADTSPLRGGYAFQSNKFEKDGVPVVKISNILPTGEVGGDFDCYNELPQDDNFVLPDGAAVLAMSGATTGKVSILNNPKKIKVYQNQRVGYFTQKKDVDYAFIKTLVKSNLFTDQLRSVLVAGAQPNVSSKDIDNFEFYFSKSIKEQSKIGGLFTNLDNLITLHQRKLEKLKNIKKACLEKMFV